MNFGASKHSFYSWTCGKLIRSIVLLNKQTKGFKTAFQLGMQYYLAKLNADWIIRAKHFKTKKSVTIRSEHKSAVLCDKLICPYAQLWKVYYFYLCLKTKTEPLCMRIITNVTPGGTPYNGLHREAPPERDICFFRLQAYVKLDRDFTHELKCMKG